MEKSINHDNSALRLVPDQREDFDVATPEKLIETIERLSAELSANERNQHIQRAVFQIAKITNSAENMDMFYSSLHHVVTNLTSIDAFFIALFHEEEGALSFPYYVDEYDDVQTTDEMPLKNRGLIPIEKCQDMLTWRVIKNNDVVRVIDIAQTNVSSIGKHSQDWLGIPLRRNGKPIGVFSIQSYQPGFQYTDEEVDLMVFISRHIASALQHRSDTEAIRKANAELAAANDQLKNEMQEREAITQRMIELSHHAGKAEIATGILHNVGNVLNSINVSAGLVEESLHRSRFGSLEKASELLNQQDDLVDFFDNDERGKVFVPYFAKLIEVLAQEKDAITSEMAVLRSHLDHVKTVVAMQQTYAGISGLKERVSLPALFQDAEVLIASSLTRHRVEIVRDFDDLPSVMLEKQKLLQVIVNLLKNAKDSMTAGRAKGRKLQIRVISLEDQHLQVEIEDNGGGISPENLSNIFSHGFTTKSDGHGFGLHSCANAIREMGGDIWATSAGIGKGATFFFKLPYQPASE